jgi:lipopolysaccharide/colanic/teichoic acid biosynthesis glycosyltransferase
MTQRATQSSASTGYSGGPRAGAPPAVARLQPVTAPGKKRATAAYLLDEDLFTAALAREFNRTDRFDEAFALLVVAPHADAGEAAWADLTEVLTRTRSDIDAIGWLKRQAAMGLIRPLVGVEPGEAAVELAVAVQRELARIRERGTASGCSISLDIYSHGRHGGQAGPFARHAPAATQEPGIDVSKRILDLAGSLALLLLFSPLFVLISALIKLTSRGPILFRQTRVGQHERLFTMLKFRTMHLNADEGLHQEYVTQFIRSGLSADSRAGNVFKIVNDPRVTRLGHFLRRASLDELPQFWNVVRGDMSLVGPRPPLPYEVARYKPWHRRRLSAAKPGITGLWQVTGRSRTTFDEMVRLDLQYARNHSLWTDIRILLATPRAVVSGKGAH